MPILVLTAVAFVGLCCCTTDPNSAEASYARVPTAAELELTDRNQNETMIMMTTDKDCSADKEYTRAHIAAAAGQCGGGGSSPA